MHEWNKVSTNYLNASSLNMFKISHQGRLHKDETVLDSREAKCFVVHLPIGVYYFWWQSYYRRQLIASPQMVARKIMMKRNISAFRTAANDNGTQRQLVGDFWDDF